MAVVHQRTLSKLFQGTKATVVPSLVPAARAPTDATAWRQLPLTPGTPVAPPGCYSCLAPSCRPAAACCSCCRPVGACVPACTSCSARSCRSGGAPGWWTSCEQGLLFFRIILGIFGSVL